MRAFFLSLLLAVSATAGPKIPLASLRAVSELGGYVVLSTETTTYRAPAGSLVLAGEDIELTGSYTSLEMQPIVMTTEYTDRWGVRHKIVTDCNGLTKAACWKSHYDMVELSKSVYPPAPLK